MARKKYKSFVFGESLFLSLKEMEAADQLRYYNYITNYGLYGVEPQLSGFERIVWLQMKTLISNLKDGRGGSGDTEDAGGEDDPFVPNGTDSTNGTNGTNGTNSTDSTNSTNGTNSTNSTNSTNLSLNKNENKNENENQYLKINESTHTDSDTRDPESCVYVFENPKKPGKPEKPPPAEDENQPRVFSFFEKPKPRGQSPPASPEDCGNILMAWNKTYPGGGGVEREVNLPECRLLPFNFNARQSEIFARALLQYSAEEIINAIKNYVWMTGNPEKVRLVLAYGSIFNFLEKALPSFVKDDVFDNSYSLRGVKNEQVGK
jgi:hypothetical protein